MIALKDDNSLVNNIKDRLNSLASEIGENSSKMKEIMRRIEGIRDNINCENRNIHDGRKDNAIELLKRATAAVLVAASLFGAFVLGKKAAKVREYKTTKETFSTVMGYDSEESYEIENDDAGKTLLYVYEPYEKKGGGYRRSYIVYDVSNISSGCETIDDYLNLNLEHAAAKDKGTEQKDNSEMTEEDFNLGNETRVIKVNQDLDDCHEYTDTETRVGLTFLFSMLVIAVEGFFIWLAWDDCFFDSLEHFDNEKGKLKEYFTKFKTDLENLKRLMDSNKQLRDDFSSVYDNYKLLLDSSEMDNFSESVMIPDPQIELDRREEKLLKKVLKDKNLS